MYILKISASFDTQYNEGYAWQSTEVACVSGRIKFLKMNSRGGIDWDGSMSGKYSEELADICSRIAWDIEEILGRLTKKAIQTAFLDAADDGSTYLPVRLGRYKKGFDADIEIEHVKP